MKRQVGVVLALATLGACSTSTGVSTLEAIETGWEDPDDEAVQQRSALETAPCVSSTGQVPMDLERRVDDWRNVIDCGESHQLQIYATVPAPAEIEDPAALYDRFSDEYRAIRDEVNAECRQELERSIGLTDVMWEPDIDAGVLFRPAADVMSGPNYAFFTPVPSAMWEDGDHALACYVTTKPRASYSLSDYVTVGASVPVDDRRCFDYQREANCSGAHAFEVFADADITGLVDDGLLDEELPTVDASTMELDSFYAVLDDACFAAYDALGLPPDADVYIWAWIDGSAFPTSAGRFEMSCQIEIAEPKQLVTGSLFD